MSTTPWRIIPALWLALAILPAATAPAFAVDDPAAGAFGSAVFLLRSGLTDSPDADTLRLIRALRQIGDPALEPYFAQLYQSSSPILKVHAMLGLAQCSPGKKLDLERLASLDGNDAVELQAQIVSSALDADVLTDEQARQLVNWTKLDNAVKVLVSAPLVKKKMLPSLDPLKEASKGGTIGRRYMALLLLLQSGDPTALGGLLQADKSTDPRRDDAREMVLDTALRFEFERVAPWAMAVCTQPGVVSNLQYLALRAALRFNAPGAAEQWRRQFDSNPDPSARIRLALIALQLSPDLPAGFYEPLSRSADPLLRQIGLTGAAVAAHKDVAPAALALIKFYHPIANNWALTYAHKYATPGDARTIFAALIRAGNEGGEQNRAERLDDALLATQMLEDASPDDAAKVLRPLLGSPDTIDLLAQSILVGLIGARSDSAGDVVRGLVFTDPDTRHDAVVLAAKAGKPLPPVEMRELEDLVRGGGDLPQMLRVEAAWEYLKITHQTQAALAAAMQTP